MIVTDTIFNVGVSNENVELFEGQYHTPEGMNYNSYLIMDNKIAILDTVDLKESHEWLKNISVVLNHKVPEYLIISHMEPDHAGSIREFIKEYPNTKLIGNAKTLVMLKQFFNTDFKDQFMEVKDGDTLELGVHNLTFVFTPMVHWPEVMMCYESTEKILFSADAFGKFGTTGILEDWVEEARRYYINIVGKYGAMVQQVLKKASALDIEVIASLHGPVLKENLSFYLDLYQKWSAYDSEKEGVLIVYSSVYGNTKNAVKELGKVIRAKTNEDVIIADLAKTDIHKLISDAFCYDKIILATITYDGGIFPLMENYIYKLISKNFQNKKIGLVENGSWGPMAAKKMKELLAPAKNLTFCEQIVSIRSAFSENNMIEIEQLADELLK